ncbi:MAG: ATPase, T2SS/T4P/T4SS family, partial [Actinomycetota bacterium]|nr:ATPase, T2SS/T4P/T4SS family [Actinomycetota bacterium]
MADTTSISSRVLDALVSAGLVTVEQLASARETANAAGTSAGTALVDRGLVTPADLATVLEEELGIPRVDLSSYAPDEEALLIMPVAVARQRNMLPLFEIEGMLTVAIGDALDVFKLDDLAGELGLEIEAVLADSASVRAAIVQYYEGAASVAAPSAATSAAPPAAGAPGAAEPVAAAAGPSQPAHPEIPELLAEEDLVVSAADFFEVPADESSVVAAPVTEAGAPATAVTEPVTIEQVVEAEAPAGHPAVDLDVLAVADTGKVALLVSDILEQAVARGASRIHLLPYKNDFFLVFRIKGRLEKIASAPLSMEGALIEGFKSFAKLSAVQASRPALNRLRADIGGKTLVLTVSVVPTVAGQRLVISLAADRPQPRTMLELGMNEAEARALHAMVERGRGLLLVSAPVAGGRSSTYYALLAHAAAVGKTVYSVERSIDYEIPA